MFYLYDIQLRLFPVHLRTEQNQRGGGGSACMSEQLSVFKLSCDIFIINPLSAVATCITKNWR